MKCDRLAHANAILATFCKDTNLSISPSGHVMVSWKTYRGENISKRWMTRGQDFFPIWKRHWSRGGTVTTALSQIVRWVQGKPVLGLSTWRYWASDTVKLCGDETLRILEQAGWPEAKCVLCGCVLHHGLDWWSLKGLSGPCCTWSNGCRQQITGGQP